MRMETSFIQEYLKPLLTVTVELDSYELHKGDNVLSIILDRIVEKTAEAFIEQHGQELLGMLEVTEISAKLQEKVTEEIAKTAIKKIFE